MTIVVEVALQIGMPIYRQQVAIREIDRLGGIVHTTRGGPQWLRSLTGDDWMRPFDRAWRVIVIMPEDDADAILSHAAKLGQLEVVRLDFTQVTDRGLSQIKDLRELKILDLNYTKTTDAGLVNLKGMSDLAEVFLNGTQVTDAGLRELTGLIKLKRIWLKKTKVTDAGVAEMKRALPDLDIER